MLYELARVVLFPLFKLFYRFSVSGRENLPAAGPVVIVANHASYLDPVAIGLATRRQVVFMAKDELFNYPVLGQLIKGFRAFPVKRGRLDKRAMRRAAGVLGAGGVLGIFPEGTRIRQPADDPAYPGAVFIAQRAGAPVVPVAIVGTGDVMPGKSKVPRFPRISVSFGRPIPMDSSTDRQAATDEVMREIATLVEVSGGH